MWRLHAFNHIWATRPVLFCYVNAWNIVDVLVGLCHYNCVCKFHFILVLGFLRNLSWVCLKLQHMSRDFSFFYILCIDVANMGQRSYRRICRYYFIPMLCFFQNLSPVCWLFYYNTVLLFLLSCLAYCWCSHWLARFPLFSKVSFNFYVFIYLGLGTYWRTFGYGKDAFSAVLLHDEKVVQTLVWRYVCEKLLYIPLFKTQWRLHWWFIRTFFLNRLLWHWAAIFCYESILKAPSPRLLHVLLN